jgi:hypothetical protein
MPHHSKKFKPKNNLEVLTEGWSQHHFKLSNGLEFDIWHNLPKAFGMNIEGAFQNWLGRTSIYTAKSFVAYINSKSHMTGHKAFATEEEWSKHVWGDIPNPKS